MKNYDTVLICANNIGNSNEHPRRVLEQKKNNVRGVFQKYAERFHRMFAVAAMLMIFHVRHAWYMLIKYR